jgi:DnaJ-class molecular chaperone
MDVEVIRMGWFQAISAWREERYENHKTEMEAAGKCPDCNGRGFPITYSAVYPAISSIYGTPADCHGCHGSGLYADWVEAHHEYR